MQITQLFPSNRIRLFPNQVKEREKLRLWERSGIHDFCEPEELTRKTALAITNLPLKKMMGVESNGMLCSMLYEYEGKECSRLRKPWPDL